MTYYILTNKNNYNIDVVYSYSTSNSSNYTHTSDSEPYIGQYIVNGSLVQQSDYDSIIAPLISANFDTTSTIVEETIIFEPESEEPPEPVVEPDIEIYGPNTQENLDQYTESALSMEKLIVYASNAANYNADGALVMNIFIRSGETRDEPGIVNILEIHDTREDYIAHLNNKLDEINNTIIPYITENLVV